MLIYIQSLIALFLGIVSTVSDFKNKKIYNKYIIIGVIVSLITYIIFFKQIEKEFLISFIINFIISFIISFAFFYIKIWGAGDAKLFIAIVFMIPYEMYEVNENHFFASMYLLIYIFSIAFVYVFLETIVLFITDNQKFSNIKTKKITKNEVMGIIIDYINGFLFSMLFNIFFSILLNNYFEQNRELIYITNILMLVFFYRIINTRKRKNIALIVLLTLNLISVFINGSIIFNINIPIMIVVFLMIIYRNISEKYNYRTIKIEELKERMILSFDSVIPFYNSRIKGLPMYTDESTDFRLSKEEVESIKKWSRSKKGLPIITIVRHLPFAPFILSGEILFFLIKLFF